MSGPSSSNEFQEASTSSHDIRSDIRQLQLEQMNQRLQQKRNWIYQRNTKEHIHELLKIIDPVHIVSDALKEILIKFITEEGGYPKIENGVLDNHVDVIKKETRNFVFKKDRFHEFLNGTMDAHPQVKEKCSECLSTIITLMSRRELNQICISLIDAVETFKFDKIETIKKFVETLCVDFEAHKKELGHVTAELSFVVCTTQYSIQTKTTEAITSSQDTELQISLLQEKQIAQLQKEEKFYVYQKSTQEVFPKFHKITELVDKIATSLQIIYVQCLPEGGGYPNIKKGVLVTPVENIDGARKKFISEIDSFQEFLNGSMDADPQVKEKCTTYISEVTPLIEDVALDSISRDLIKSVDNYLFRDIETIGKSAKELCLSLEAYSLISASVTKEFSKSVDENCK